MLLHACSARGFVFAKLVALYVFGAEVPLLKLNYDNVEIARIEATSQENEMGQEMWDARRATRGGDGGGGVRRPPDDDDDDDNNDRDVPRRVSG